MLGVFLKCPSKLVLIISSSSWEYQISMTSYGAYGAMTLLIDHRFYHIKEKTISKERQFYDYVQKMFSTFLTLFKQQGPLNLTQLV